MLPRVVKKMRKVDGDASMMEECTSSFSPFPFLSSFVLLICFPPALSLLDYDMIFADDEQASNPASLKFLQLAADWKKKQALAAASNPAEVAVEEEEEEESEEEESEDEKDK